jgi:hypothetical protein
MFEHRVNVRLLRSYLNDVSTWNNVAQSKTVLTVASGNLVQLILRRIGVLPREIGIRPSLQHIDQQQNEKRTQVYKQVFVSVMPYYLHILFSYVLFYVLFSAKSPISINWPFSFGFRVKNLFAILYIYNMILYKRTKILNFTTDYLPAINRKYINLKFL